MARISVEPRRFSLARRALFRTVESACRLAGGRAFYRSRYLSAGRFWVRREEVLIPGLAAPLDGYTLAQLSDFHGGPFLRASDLTDALDRVAALAPQAIVLTGDFATHRPEEALELAPAFVRLRAPGGVFAVFGNHDYKWRREAEIALALERAGVRMLRNAHFSPAPGLVIAGIEDLEEGKPSDLDAALAGAPVDATKVLLSHHPDGLTHAAERGIALVLSGHTHGGQVLLPILRSLGPRHPGDRVQHGATTLLVSHGVGAIGLPLRVGTRAEALLVTLRRS